MPTALQTPIRREDKAQQVGPRRYRKQILPIGKVPYEDERGKRELEFSHDYLAKAAKAFNQGAYDQVAFQLADGENKHNLDPEKTRGEMTALELADDGLYGIFDLSDEGAKLIADNPKLGVSCRIVQDHPKGPAIQHVLGTLDPRATGMGPWEKLDLAKTADGTTLIDLTEAEFTVASAGVSDGSDSSSAVGTDSQLSDTEVAALRKVLAKDGGTEGDLSDEDKAALNALLGEPEPVALSAKAQETIDLATRQAKDAQDAADRANEQLAAERWKNEKAEYLRAGVPPKQLDLAAPHLSKASAVIELSKSDSEASAMRKMLEEAKGTIDMSERGVNYADDDSDEAKARELADDKHWEKV